jgi:ppGpp synthetase/RelA/SpoT-type nucleotidyltranferase
MKSIEEKIEGINFVSTKFDDLRKEFISNQELIVEALKKLIEKYADDFALTKLNSVRKIKFYNIVYRVKEKDSFSEKLIRNNDYNLFSESLADLENIDEPTLKSKIKEIDDLIGLKILTDLNVDTLNMFKLISSTNFINEAKSKGFTFNQTDLEGQPVRMKNGLDIYKLRCSYETWNFELQIKSKLESAWGDMEHAIFYKDYKITPVRDLAQQSMNHIGKLLKQIDEFLQEIREASDNFELNSKVILFVNEFEKLNASKIEAILNGINYNFKKIASLSFNINEIDNFLLNEYDLSTAHLSLDCQKYSEYIGRRNSDFDLQIFESIVISGKGIQVTEENIESTLDDYFSLIKASYSQFTLSNNIVQDIELAERYVEIFFDSCVSFNCKEFILNTNNVLNHLNHLKLIEEIIEVLGLNEGRIKNLLCAYSIYCFEGNLQLYVDSINKDELLNDLESSKNEIQKVKIVENNLIEGFNSLINVIG